jgi:glycosyltransferase involved in cell wall biosynthesis
MRLPEIETDVPRSSHGASHTKGEAAASAAAGPGGSVSSVQAVQTAPLVSIVVPCYRQAHFLGDALDSARAQTHEPIEVVVVDDGSPDDVAAVVARYPGVRLIRQTNQGLAAARNTGLEASTGAFVTFLDADDVLYPDAVARGLASLDGRDDCAFAAGMWRTRAESGELEPAHRRVPEGSAYEEMLRGNFIVMHGAVLYRREALVAIGGFRAELPSCEDYDVYLRLLRRWDVALHEGTVAEYRRHDHNMTRSARRMLRGYVPALRAQRAHAQRDQRLAAAYAAGIARGRQYYGEQVLTQLSSALRARSGLAHAAGDAWALVRHDPGLLFGRFARLVWRSVSGRGPNRT